VTKSDEIVVAPPGWARSPRGRRELLVAGLFVAFSIAIPLVCTEWYPFSRAPMFSDAPRLYCDYSVQDDAGRSLPLVDFGLQRNYWGNPLGVGVGFEPPPSVDSFGAIAPAEEVAAHVTNGLKRYPDLPAVVVTQTVVGARADGTVGSTATTTWRIENPVTRGEADR
jgi:hypothetical protein